MKNLIIALSFVLSLFLGQAVVAQDQVFVNTTTQKIETFVEVSTPEVANFEIYSLELTKTAISSLVDVMADSLASSVSSAGSQLAGSTSTSGSST